MDGITWVNVKTENIERLAQWIGLVGPEKRSRKTLVKMLKRYFKKGVKAKREVVV